LVLDVFVVEKEDPGKLSCRMFDEPSFIPTICGRTLHSHSINTCFGWMTMQ
jgi:hypothetical protein